MCVVSITALVVMANVLVVVVAVVDNRDDSGLEDNDVAVDDVVAIVDAVLAEFVGSSPA